MKSGKLSITLLVFLGSSLLLSSILGAVLGNLKQLKETDSKTSEVEKLTTRQFLFEDTDFFRSNVIYSENFNSGSNLGELGFTGREPTYWTLDTAQKNMASTCPVNGSSNIYTPQFEASRTNRNITVLWSVLPAERFSGPITTISPTKVLPLPLSTPAWLKPATRGEVSLVDTENIPVYSLVYEPNPNGIKVSLFKYNKAQPLKSAVIPGSGMSVYQVYFRIDLNCPAGGGDIIVSYNKGGIVRRYIQCIKVKDETYRSFSKLKFGYQRGKAGQIAIDNIWVSSTTVPSPGPTVARTATPRRTPTPPPVDLEPPVTQIVLKPAPNEDGWVNSDVQVHFESEDNVSGVKETHYKIDGGAVLIYEPQNPSVITTNGWHTVQYRSVDNVGYKEEWCLESFKIDRLAPNTTVCPDPGSNWHKGVFTLNFYATDNACGSGVKGTWYKYKVDGGDFGDVQTGNTVSFSDSGIYTVEYWSVDNLGNVEKNVEEESHKTVTVKLDNDDPVTTHNLTPPANRAGWNNSDVTISFSATDTGGSGVAETKYKYKVDGGDFGEVQTGNTVSFSNSGIYTVKYWSIDRAGNVEEAKLVEVKLDKTPPSITDLRPPNNYHYENTSYPKFEATFSDDLSGIDITSIKLYLKVETESKTDTDFGSELSGCMKFSMNDNNITICFTPDHDLTSDENNTVTYTVTFKVLDCAGNEKYVSRTFVIYGP